GEHVPWPYLWPKLARVLGVSKERLQELFADESPSSRRDDPTAVVPPHGARQATETISFYRREPQPTASIGPSQDRHPHAGLPMRAELLAQYEALTDSYRQIDYQAGAGAVYVDTVAHLNRLLAAADQVPSTLYQRYSALLGDTAQLAAWLAIDGQDY